MPRQTRSVSQPRRHGRSGEIPDAVSSDREEIARLAYLHWLDRGCPIGSPEEDWSQAEQDLKNGQTQTA
ncbi:MAG: DUF2934 domain-containing protein [Acidobacteriia bacterium]|nr:DUF2934 domain-containing protein [Terriglobia bacterium]